MNAPERTDASRAKRVAMAACRKAAAIHTDPSMHRSTRSRSAYKLKAEALDRVVRILNGKE